MSFSGVLPELVRNIRIQLRPRRLFAVVLISFLGSVSAYIYYIDSANSGGSSGLLSFLVNVAVTVLAIGGGVYCLQSIHRDMELNSFVYQRITRLTPLELVLGKLFGAPSLVYFIVLCLLPATLLAAYLSHLAVSTFFAVYIVLLLGSIALHALALSMSALVGRGNSAGSIILFLLLFYIFALLGANRDSTLALQGLSPYFVNQLLNPGVPPYQQPTALPAGQDLLLGHPVSHVLVLLVLYLTFTAWFLLGLVRNIKARSCRLRDLLAAARVLFHPLYPSDRARLFPVDPAPYNLRSRRHPTRHGISACALAKPNWSFWPSAYGSSSSSVSRCCAIASGRAAESTVWAPKPLAFGQRSGPRLTC